MTLMNPEISNKMDNNMNNDRRRIFLGLTSLLIFLFVIAFSGLVVTSKDTPLSSYFSKVANFIEEKLGKSKSKYGGVGSVIQQHVVQEESQIIDVVDKVSPSVVSIVVKTVNFDLLSGPSSSEQGIGTGFIVDKNGLIVTNSHVVDSVEGDYSVILKDGTAYPVQKIHLDQLSDLAILEITARDLPVVELGDSDLLKVGQRAIAIGNALGKYQNTVTVGVVSGVERELTAYSPFGESKTYENAIQTDAAINPGNSGGPLLNSAGQLIGINFATTEGANNVSFAIPVNTLKPLLESFLKEGRIIRPYIGVSYTMVTKELSKLRNLPEGAYVSSVLPNSPAKKADIRRGDIVLKIDGKDINADNSLSKEISTRRVGDTVALSVDRDGTRMNINVLLEEAPEKF